MKFLYILRQKVEYIYFMLEVNTVTTMSCLHQIYLQTILHFEISIFIPDAYSSDNKYVNFNYFG